MQALHANFNVSRLAARNARLTRPSAAMLARHVPQLHVRRRRLCSLCVFVAGAGASIESLAATILDAGLAKFVDWSARALPANSDDVTASASALKKREIAAREAQKGLWKDAPPPSKDTNRVDGTIQGKVVEVVSGDTLVVQPAGGGVPVRFSLARYARFVKFCVSIMPTLRAAQPACAVLVDCYDAYRNVHSVSKGRRPAGGAGVTTLT